MKALLASTAIVGLSTSLALADAHSGSPFAETAEGNVLYTSDLVGARLYVSESEGGELEAQAEWDDVGEIHDIIVNRDGSVQHVLADIGGFLGLGEKRVAVAMDSLQFVSDGEGSTEYFIVMEGSRSVLEDAPEFDRQASMSGDMHSSEEEMETTAENTSEEEMETTAANTAEEIETEAEETAQQVGNAASNAGQNIEEAAEETAQNLETHAEETEQSVENMAEEAETELQTETAEIDRTLERPVFTPPAIERDGYQMAERDSLTSEEIEGARVYDATDEWIGEVNTLVLNADGTIEEAVIDVGGFLGLGEKQIALSMDELNIQRGAADVRIYVDATEEQLEQLPEWEG